MEERESFKEREGGWNVVGGMREREGEWGHSKLEEEQVNRKDSNNHYHFP